MTTTLPETESPCKRVSRHGILVLRISFQGVESVELIGDESTTEEHFQDVLRTIRPQLEQIHDRVVELSSDLVGLTR